MLRRGLRAARVRWQGLERHRPDELLEFVLEALDGDVVDDALEVAALDVGVGGRVEGRVAAEGELGVTGGGRLGGCGARWLLHGWERLKALVV